MVDIVAVGALLVPYLSKAAARVATHASDAVGDAAMEFARRIWSKLGDRLAERPGAQEVIDDVAAAPENEDARAALRHQLSKVLEEDSALAAEVDGILQEAVAADVIRVTGDGNIVIGGEVRNSTFISGSGNNVNTG